MTDAQAVGSKALVRAVGVEKTFTTSAGEIAVLRGVDLEVLRGQTLSIAGESGSGKSTLLAMLAGLDVPSAGLLEVAGRNLAACSEEDLADFRARSVGIVFQHFHLIRSLTALENVRLPLELRDGADPADRARDALNAVGLSHRHGHFPAQLSGGECQRVAIARALVCEPELLLADEPTGNLDGKTGRQVVDLLFDLVESRDTTMVLVTHSATLAARCARSLMLTDGRLHHLREGADTAASPAC